MTPIPTSVKVGPYRYRVLSDAESILAMKREHTNWNGMTDYQRQEITLDTAAAPDVLAEVLIHEVKHVIDFAAGLGMDESISAHENIYRTSAWTLLVLRENPDLVAFLTATE